MHDLFPFISGPSLVFFFWGDFECFIHTSSPQAEKWKAQALSQNSKKDVTELDAVRAELAKAMVCGGDSVRGVYHNRVVGGIHEEPTMR